MHLIAIQTRMELRAMRMVNGFLFGHGSIMHRNLVHRSRIFHFKIHRKGINIIVMFDLNQIIQILVYILLISMFLFMFFQLTTLEEGFLTFRAFKRLFFSVSVGQMFIVIGFLSEYQFAVFTFNFELVTMYNFHMTFKVVLAGKGHETVIVFTLVRLRVITVSNQMSF